MDNSKILQLNCQKKLIINTKVKNYRSLVFQQFHF
jgi:hypothetical protein